MPNPLIIALDVSSPIKALHLVSKLKVCGAAFKVGMELFTAAGPKIVEKIINHDVRVFLDLKFYDIPTTVARTADVATRMGVWMFNVHAHGGREMMTKAKEASLDAASAVKIDAPLVIAVTVLTSLKQLDEQNVSIPLAEQVLSLARLARSSGLDGVVASGLEAKGIRQTCGKNFRIVTPGIRLPDSPPDDQKRKLSPSEALEEGADYIVVGRPITSAPRPLTVVEAILRSFPDGV